MSKIENIKTYNGQDLDNIFFRPMLTGKSAEELGIRVLYNMPVPTTLHFWRRSGDILQSYAGRGWNGSEPSEKYQKTLSLNKVKAEMSYAAEDYFSTVYELITGRPDVNLDDLSGTELEQAETQLFRQSIAESIRATMWYGDEDNDEQLITFNGLLKHIIMGMDASAEENRPKSLIYYPHTEDNKWAEELLANMWKESSDYLRSLRSEGQLAFFVSSDVYNAYEESLDSATLEAAYLAKQNGRDTLSYRGIPVVDVQMSHYRNCTNTMPHSFALLTDRRNLVLAVNTSDMPGTEVRMWYNPDEMENRQRAIFMAGCDFLAPELITFARGLPLELLQADWNDQSVDVRILMHDDVACLQSYCVELYDADDNELDSSNSFKIENSVMSTTLSGSNALYLELVVTYTSGEVYKYREYNA